MRLESIRDIETRKPLRAQTPRDLLAIGLGAIVTLCVQGYQFGEGNHTIYLLDALRRTQTDVLQNDWFTARTFQYHATFGVLSHWLLSLQLIRAAFLLGYLLLVVLFHVAWLRIVRELGGGATGYLASVALYYLSAAGTGLGMYQFFQDSSFLPSNIANVLFLCGIATWIGGKIALSGVCFGIAGLFHLNHAVVVVVMWMTLGVFEYTRTNAKTLTPTLSWRTRRGGLIAGSLCALVPAVGNILFAARAKLDHGGQMSLAEFVDLYVRLRHPHHYDPSTWPTLLWVSFLWTMPLALYTLWRKQDEAWRRTRPVFIVLLALQLAALLGAGIWYFSETLIQLSLYRFSIFIQLLACIAVATFLGVRLLRVAAMLCIAIIVACFIRGPFFGVFVMPQDDAEYRALCDWARQATPIDAILLVPPHESSMRLHGRRAIVVNYKAVPQFSGELPEWRDRLSAVLGLEDLHSLPKGYRQTLDALRDRYTRMSADQLREVANRYDARFVLALRPLELNLVHFTANRRYFVYDLGEAGGAR